MGKKKFTGCVSIALSELNNTCFVIMPFNRVLEVVYEQVFRPAVEASKLSPVRGDEVYSSRKIMEDIWESIRMSRCVLAELTGRNGNVLYELGLSHALGKPVVIVTGDMNDVPFDLRHLRCIVYDKNIPNWGEQLKNNISETIDVMLKKNDPSDLFKDISVDAEFPELPAEPVKAKYSQKHTLEGDWTMEESYDGGETKAIVELFQEGDELYGNMLITDRPVDDAEFVIRESVTGFIEGNEVKIAGTSFQILEGPAIDYGLDQWSGTIVDPNTIEGNSIDSDGIKGNFRMKRT